LARQGSRARWDTDLVRDDLRGCVVEHLEDEISEY
jgi:hypothetical protein